MSYHVEPVPPQKASRREVTPLAPCRDCRSFATRINLQKLEIAELGREISDLRQTIKEQTKTAQGEENVRLRVKVASLEEKIERQTGIIDDLKTKVVELQAKLPPPQEARVIHLYSEPTESGPAKAVNTHYRSLVGKNGLTYGDASPGQENAIRAMEGE